MISKEEYKKTLIRMWDSVRIDDKYKGTNGCSGVECKRCPVTFLCGDSTEIVYDAYELVEFVEKWGKEHPIETNGSRFLKNYPKAEVYSCDSNDGGINMKELANNSTNEDLIEFAKEQCEIFPKDSYMGKYLRETLKILQAEPCENAISREDVIKAIDRHTFDTDDGLCLDEDISIILEGLPPVKPVACISKVNFNKGEMQDD